MKHVFVKVAVGVMLLGGLPAFGQSSGPSSYNPSASLWNEGPAEDAPMHASGGVLAPKVIHSVMPKLSGKAKTKYYGVVKVYCWVETDGKPSHIRVANSMGTEPDKAAIAAVQQYRFKPATYKGKPVKVDLFIQVQIYY